MKLKLCLLALVLTLPPITEASAAPGVDPRNRNCLRFYKQWQAQPSHKAFAVATDDRGQACGGSWGARSRKEAEARARKWCRKFAENGAYCRITESK